MKTVSHCTLADCQPLAKWYKQQLSLVIQPDTFHRFLRSTKTIPIPFTHCIKIELKLDLNNSNQIHENPEKMVSLEGNIFLGYF